MAEFTFNWSQEQTYPDIVVNGAVLVAEPQKVYDLDSAPDDRFVPVTTSSAPEVTTAPSEGES